VTARACSNCGHPVSESVRFCAYCGQDVTRPSSTVLVADPGQIPSATDDEQPPWRAVEAFAIYIIAVIATVAIMVPLGFALRPLTGCGDLVGAEATRCFHHRDLLTALSIGVNEAALLATVLLWIRLVHKQRPRSLGFRGLNAVNAFIGMGVGLAGLFVAGVISAALTSIIRNVSHRPVEAPKQISLQTHPMTLVLVVVGFSVIVLAPLAEEAFFRGFIFGGLRRWLRPGWAIVLSAAVFGIAHFIPLIMLPIFGLGVLLASIAYSRKSLVPSIFAHATFNAIGFIQLFVSVRH
jgi:membrane protease YdiL (CAAX protease family)/RNA polymerase subunit RPABC4/transcription elongation factor Spt4